MNPNIVNTIASTVLGLGCIITGAILSANGISSGDVLIGGGLGIVGKYAIDRKLG